jgi:hypothetical protein
MPPKPETQTATADFVTALAALSNVGANKINPAFKARYVTLDVLLDSVKATLSEYNLALRQVLISEDGKIGVQTTFLHIDGTVFDAGRLLVKSDTLTAQQVGSALTYIRRQSIQTAAGISTDLDDDGASASSYKASQAPSLATLKSNAPWYSFLTAMEAERAHQYCVTKGWLSEKSIDLIELPADKVDMILSNKPSFIKAISK